MEDVKLKFYNFNQNNSGGSFVEDEEAGIGTDVIIEAKSAKSANKIAKGIGIYFNGCDKDIDCNCCGDRWYKVDDSDGKDVPSIWGKPIEEAESGLFRSHVYVHYKDGRIVKHELAKV